MDSVVSMKDKKWTKGPGGNWTLIGKKVWLSYQDFSFVLKDMKAAGIKKASIDSLHASMRPETAIILNGAGKARPKFLILYGDHRKQLTPLFPDIKKLKAYWKKGDIGFWSDSLKG